VIDSLPELDFEVVPIETEGDRDKVTPLSRMETTDFFTSDIEKALLENRIDVAVHSAKDLEDRPPDELAIAAITDSISPYECLVSRGNLTMRELVPKATVGTSSLKRKSALRRFRRDLIVKDIRGDIDERITRLDNGEFDAIIIAHAALIRLRYECRIAEIVPPDIIEPHPLQGRLALQVRRDRTDLIELFRGIDEKQ